MKPPTLLLTSLACALVCLVCTAQPEADTVDEAAQQADNVFDLWPGDPPGEPVYEGELPEEETLGGGRIRFVHHPTITLYQPDPEVANGAAVVICPGGGYGILAAGHEGIAVANWLNDHGITAIVLKYRHSPYRHPVPMHDAQRAVRLVRHHAEGWGIDPKRVGIMGFSAGGHLASTVATHFDAGDSEADDPVAHQSCRPDFAILIYPVIAMQGEHTHRGSRRNLLGPDFTDEQASELNNPEHVDEDTPPTLLAHSRDDRGVALANSEMFYTALQEHNIESELLILNTGGHGFGLGRPEGDSNQWPARCIEWLTEVGVATE